MSLLIKLRRLLVLLTLLLVCVRLTATAPKTWPYMKTYDIWETNKTVDTFKDRSVDYAQNVVHTDLLHDNENRNSTTAIRNRRKGKVINFFSLPVDDECLTDDGRRIGMCMNVYECRIQGGTSRGDCALGFGACCVFESTCDQEVYNNITYFVSPKFPALMPSDKEHCSIKIKLVSDDISQIRLDFLHFSLSQPNRMTGACESDVFSIEGGIYPFVLCGQNSGQHIFYDVGSPKARAENQELKINVNLSKRSVSTRMWEIRISQIPFSSKAPSGCLQHFTGIEGIIQTFNFADNGRHLANQDYRSCVRQEKGRCSIQYEPCDDQSFRIGPTLSNGAMGSGSMGAMGGFPGSGTAGGLPGSATAGGNPALADELLADETQLDDEMEIPDDDMLNDPVDDDLTQMDPDVDDADADDATADADNPAADADNPAADANNPASDTADNPAAEQADPADQAQQDETQQQQDDPQQQQDEQEEGSGGGGGGGFFSGFPSFSFPSFFRSFSNRHSRHSRQSRHGRQLFSPCTDRITLPCIVEDFIGAGMGDIPTCIPVHCGNSLCQAGALSCKIETSVTPFHIGVHFGDGKTNKGSPEDNIGACLRYRQLPCS